METGKIVLGSAVTLGANAGIQWAVAKVPFETDPATLAEKSVRGRDIAALALELGVSTGSYFVFGTVPAVLGAAEAFLFLALKAAGVGTPAPAPAAAPAPAPAPAPVPTPRERIPSYSQLLEYGRQALPYAQRLLPGLLKGARQPALMVVR